MTDVGKSPNQPNAWGDGEREKVVKIYCSSGSDDIAQFRDEACANPSQPPADPASSGSKYSPCRKHLDRDHIFWSRKPAKSGMKRIEWHWDCCWGMNSEIWGFQTSGTLVIHNTPASSGAFWGAYAQNQHVSYFGHSMDSSGDSSGD